MNAAVKTVIESWGSGKVDKVSGGTAGNFAGLTASGMINDSGKKPSDFLTQHQDISGKQNIINYSTTEQNMGRKWIDGKTIYSKLIDLGTIPANSTYTSQNINTYVPNVETIVFRLFICKGTDAGSDKALYMHGAIRNTNGEVKLDPNFVGVRYSELKAVIKSTFASATTAYMYLEYTKSA